MSLKFSQRFRELFWQLIHNNEDINLIKTMGESKRRQQLDPTYGKTPLLTSQAQKEKHVNAIVESLTTKFEPEIKAIASAEAIPDNYREIKQKIHSWLEQVLEPYRASDRTLIASSMMACFAQIANEYETSPLLIKCFFEILEPLLPEKNRERIKKVIEKIEVELVANHR